MDTVYGCVEYLLIIFTASKDYRSAFPDNASFSERCGKK